MRQVRQPHNARARQACYDDDDYNATVEMPRLRRRGIRRKDPRSTSVCVHGRRTDISQHCYSFDHYSASTVDFSVNPEAFKWQIFSVSRHKLYGG